MLTRGIPRIKKMGGKAKLRRRFLPSLDLTRRASAKNQTSISRYYLKTYSILASHQKIHKWSIGTPWIHS